MEHLQCEVEYQEADAATGHNRLTLACPRASVLKRRSGVEIVSESPALRKALKLLSEPHEIYFRFAADGKAALVKRDRTRICQFNLHHAEPDQLLDLVRFCLRLGVVPKSPLDCLRAKTTATAAPSTAPKRPAPQDAETHRARHPLRDLSNWSPPSPLPSQSTQLKKQSPLLKRRRVERPSHALPQPSLTQDQRRVLDVIAASRSVFFTGSAGTGKSFLLQQILDPNGPLRAFIRGKRIFATATTGIAAYNIGGMTLHHFAGLDTRTQGDSSISQLLPEIRRKKDALQRWRSVDVLVIDEISMLDGRLFDLLEELARELRPDRRGAFFGGIQLVVSGDFLQLPPVATRDQRDKTLLCFQSDAWARGVKDVVELTQIFRQTNSAFVDILNALRVGQPTRAMIDKLNECYKRDASDDDAADHESAIRIFTHNNDVLETNTKRLDSLPGRKFNYLSADTGRSEFLSSCPASSTLSLKKNARVMLIKSINPTSGLVNGCRGVVVGFTPQTQLPIVKFSTGATEIVQQEDFPVRLADTVLASRRQLPLALAWAISIHKSQGLAFPRAVIDLSRVFEFGQAYVALSRVRSLEGLRLLRRLDANRLLLADKRVLQFCKELRS